MLNRIAEVTKPPTKPLYSPHGYIITQDGTTYTLLKQWCHGVVIACLFPEALAAFNLDLQAEGEEQLVIPKNVDEINVFAFQNFELKTHRQFDLVRICPTRMLGPTSVDLPYDKPCTPEQMAAMRLVMQEALSLRLSTKVATDHCDMTLIQCYQCAESGKNGYELGFGRSSDNGDNSYDY